MMMTALNAGPKASQPLSQSLIPCVASTAFVIIFVGFGAEAIVGPSDVLIAFEFEPAVAAADWKRLIASWRPMASGTFSWDLSTSKPLSGVTP